MGLRRGWQLWLTAVSIAGLSALAAPSQVRTVAAPVLRARITTDRALYQEHERVPIHLWLTNTGPEAIFLPWGAWAGVEADIRVSPKMILTTRGHAGDPGLPPKTPEPLAVRLAACCIRLGPGDSYVREYSLDSFAVESSLRPGNYTISLTYGAPEPSRIFPEGWVAASPAALAQLPHAFFEGVVRTNSVIFHIVKRSPARKDSH